MKITVLGNCGPYPRAGGACSGYLFEHEETRILLDCGNGVLSRLQQIIDPKELDIIILTHLHSDHISDAMILRYALGISQMKGMLNKSIPLYAPSSPIDDFQKLQFKNAFELHEIQDALTLHVNELEIHFQHMDHPVPCYGVSITDHKKKFVYTGDTKYCPQLVEFAKDADLLLCECGILEKDKTTGTAHLSAKDTGEIAKSCNVGQLLLTHFWPEYDLTDIYNEAKNSFGREPILSQEMQDYEV